MADVQFALSGVEELSASLKDLSDDVRKKGGRFALRKAANVVADSVRAGAKRLDDPATTSQEIAKNVTIRFGSKTFRRTGNLMFRVGILGGARVTSIGARRSRRSRSARGVPSLESLGEFSGQGANNPGGDTWYWRFLEFGTERINARSFMRVALERNAGNAANEFVAQFKKGLDRVVSRYARIRATRARAQ